MPFTIALAGNPNCGKTTMFNELTGSNQFVGNWPGVTVEKKEGRLKGHKDVAILDLPGIYSLSPYTLEEVVTRNCLLGDKPDVILNLVDAANIERNLYLTTQLAEMGIPVVIALNMMDVVRKRGDEIDTQGLAKALGCPVIETAAVRGEGCMAAAELAINLVGSGAAGGFRHRFSDPVEKALGQVEQLIGGQVPAASLRWYAIKLFERDEQVLGALQLDEFTRGTLEEIVTSLEDEMEDDAESIIIGERYAYIAQVVQKYIRKVAVAMSQSDKIDQIVTNRWLALPIFACVMLLVYYISISTVGAMMTDFTTNTFFGEWLSPLLEEGLTKMETAPWLTGLVVDGIVGGVGSVLGFVPQMFVLFLMLSILEDCGYMARVAFIMDRIFRRFNLSGKSFIPMLISTGCGVPGVMASRTIEQDRDRKMTIMTTTFIPCGAKMPIVALISGVVFGGVWWVAPSAYFVGIAAVLISGILLKKTRLFAGDPSPFVMELPPYHLPTLSNVFRATWERGWSFIKKAGTIILLTSILVWFTSSYGFVDGVFGMVEETDQSILAVLGSGLAVVFRPLGFGSWQAAVATLLGLVAKEEVVGVFGTLYAISGDALELVKEGAFGELSGLANYFTPLSAYAFLVFNLLCAPCFAAIGAIKREMNSGRWTLFALGYQTVFAYTVSLMLYQFGLFFSEGSFGVGTVVACACLAGYIWLIFRKGYPKQENAPGVVVARAKASL